LGRVRCGSSRPLRNLDQLFPDVSSLQHPDESLRGVLETLDDICHGACSAIDCFQSVAQIITGLRAGDSSLSGRSEAGYL